MRTSAGPYPAGDHDIFQTFEGDNIVLLQQVATFLLKQYQRRFRGAPLIATFRYLTEIAGDVVPSNPLTSHDTDPRHIRDPVFLRRAMEHRVARLLHTAASRLSREAKSVGQFQVCRCFSRTRVSWVPLLNLYLAGRPGTSACPTCSCWPTPTSRQWCWTRCSRLWTAARTPAVGKPFVSWRSSTPYSGSTRTSRSGAPSSSLPVGHTAAYRADVSGTCCRCRDDDFLAPSKAKAIRRAITELCLELRPMALPLVAAFDYPDHILRAPIGLQHAEANEMYSDYLKEIGFDGSGGAQQMHYH